MNNRIKTEMKLVKINFCNDIFKERFRCQYLNVITF